MTGYYPVAPLLELAGITYSQLAQAANIAGSEYPVYRDRGVSSRVADRLAVRCGFHPALVWPEWVDDSITELLERRGRSCVDCGARFLPRQRDQRFCPGGVCAQRWHGRERMRRIRATPEGRAANLAAVREWRQGLSPAARRAQLVKQRQRDRAKAAA